MDQQACKPKKLDLAVETLRIGGVLRLQALGSSMLPSLWPGDLLTIQRSGLEGAEPGDIVLFAREARFFIHRLREKTAHGFITRGDAMPQNDPPVAAEELLGRVSLIRRGQACLAPAPLSIGGRIFGRLLAHSDLCRRIALRLHFQLKNHGLKSDLAPST